MSDYKEVIENVVKDWNRSFESAKNKASKIDGQYNEVNVKKGILFKRRVAAFVEFLERTKKRLAQFSLGEEVLWKPSPEFNERMEARMKAHYKESPLPWYSSPDPMELFKSLKGFVKFPKKA